LDEGVETLAGDGDLLAVAVDELERHDVYPCSRSIDIDGKTGGTPRRVNLLGARLRCPYRPPVIASMLMCGVRPRTAI
jgi:hypothetical protein